MFAPDQRFQVHSRLPLATVERVVSARMEPTRVKGNAQPAVFNRQVAMYLAKHISGWSTPRVGKFHNGRHRSTVLWALKHIAAMRTLHPEVDGLISALTEEIRYHGRKDFENGYSCWADKIARLHRISALGTIDVEPSAMKEPSAIQPPSAPTPSTGVIDIN